MKERLKIFSILCCCILLTSCDPGRVINIINNTNSNVKVKFISTSDVKYQSLEQLFNGDSLVINLQSFETRKNEKQIHLGMGVWDEEDIDAFVKSIKSVEINTKDITTIYKSPHSIQSLLKDNRKGFIFKSLVEINIK